jgi:nucleoside-diphosphate-sugar epimerase
MSAARFTVLGGGGYVGSHLAPALRARGAEVTSLGREDDPFGRDLGHVVYAIAVTNDSSERADEAVRANVCLVLDLLRGARFESFLYLSSAQVYFGAERSSEDAVLRVDPREVGDVYRASKILGETVCLASDRAAVRVARLSAVYGERLSPRSFLAGVVREAVDRGAVVLRSSLDSERDFVHVADVVEAIAAIAVRGKARLYNVASGRNTTNAAIVDAVARATGCSTSVAAGAPRSAYPAVDVTRLREDLGVVPSADVIARVPAIVRAYRECAAGAEGGVTR